MKTNNYMKRMGSRGLSPVIASVLMIMLVLVLAAMIFLWARGFISEQIEKFGQPIEDACSNVDFSVAKYGENKLEIRNRGNVDIWYLDVKVFDEDGNSEIRKFDVRVDAGNTTMVPISLYMDSGEPIDKIIVYPALIGNIRSRDARAAFTCMDAGVTL